MLIPEKKLEEFEVFYHIDASFRAIRALIASKLMFFWLVRHVIQMRLVVLYRKKLNCQYYIAVFVCMLETLYSKNLFQIDRSKR